MTSGIWKTDSGCVNHCVTIALIRGNDSWYLEDNPWYMEDRLWVCGRQPVVHVNHCVTIPLVRGHDPWYLEDNPWVM